MDCFLSIIENLLRYFNTYAFTQVAIYGKSYIDAAKSTWDLVQTSGVGGIINDNLIGSVLSLSALFSGLISSAVGFSIFSLLFKQATDGQHLIAFFVSLAVSTIMSWCTLSIVRSGVTTFYVCLAEDPAALQRTDPEMHQKVRSRYGFLNL